MKGSPARAWRRPAGPADWERPAVRKQPGEKGMAALRHYQQEGEQVYLAMQYLAMQRDIAARWPTTSSTTKVSDEVAAATSAPVTFPPPR
eukprot:Skav217984  [mRNA]  locus=scaffold496:476977:478043:- [translate_table: standard]